MLGDKKVVALVPIKAHSERVKEKNFRGFLGRPLYFHILGTLQEVDSIDEVCIDTDSQRVMKEAPKNFCRVRIIVRPEEIRGDYVSTNKIFAYDLTQTDGDIYLQTHATNPLLRAETIERALQRFVENGKHDSLFGVNHYQSRFYDEHGQPVNHDPDNLIRTQDLPPMYEENSCIYVFTKRSFAKTNARIGSEPLLFETPRLESLDIDNEESWALAEAVAVRILARR